MLSRLMTRREQLLLLGVAAAICLGALALYFHDRDAPRESADSLGTVTPAEGVGGEQRGADAEVAVDHKLAGTLALPAGTLALPDKPVADVEIGVSVAGAVRAPGFYSFASSARVNDALEAAGGIAEQADLSDINLAAKLIDGTTLTIPAYATSTRPDGQVLYRRSRANATYNPPEYTISGWRPASPPSQTTTVTQSTPQTPIAAAGIAHNGLLDLNSATQDMLEDLPGIGPKLAESIIRYRSQSPFTSVEDLTNVEGIGSKRLEAVRTLVTVN